MPNSLPFPIRVAAGLVSAGLETFRRLPGDLPAMGVEVAGAVTKVALRVRQQITDLAIRGDELLEPTLEPVERPSWAQFDDEAPADTGVRGGATARGDAGGATAGGGAVPTGGAVPPGADAAGDAVHAGGGGIQDVPLDQHAGQVAPAVTAPADAVPVDPGPARARRARVRPAGAQAVNSSAVGAEFTDAPLPADADASASASASAASQHSASERIDALGRSPALPGYDGMTLAQVRGHLRRLALGDVQSLLRHELSGGNRPAFVTMLTNRISTLEQHAR